MKKDKIFGGIVVLAVAAVAAVNVNVNLNSQKSDLPAISLANVEALAQEGGFFEELGKAIDQFLNSKVYKCVPQACSAVTSERFVGVYYVGSRFVFASYERTYGPGHKEDCQLGSVVAHCSDCNTSCVPN